MPAAQLTQPQKTHRIVAVKKKNKYTKQVKPEVLKTRLRVLPVPRKHRYAKRRLKVSAEVPGSAFSKSRIDSNVSLDRTDLRAFYSSWFHSVVPVAVSSSVLIDFERWRFEWAFRVKLIPRYLTKVSTSNTFHGASGKHYSLMTRSLAFHSFSEDRLAHELKSGGGASTRRASSCFSVKVIFCRQQTLALPCKFSFVQWSTLFISFFKHVHPKKAQVKTINKYNLILLNTIYTI